MTKYEDQIRELIGKEFGNRLVIGVVRKSRASLSEDRVKFGWYCVLQCSLGHISEVRKCELNSSCLKCYVPKHKKSDKRGSKIYNIWKAMRQRCMNPNCKDYEHYGARGIYICERWNTFTNFYEDMGDKPEGLSLDRIDNSGPYSKENCKWSTQKEQVANARMRKNHVRDLTNEVIGQWTVVRRNGVSKRGLNLWECVCSCGKVKNIPTGTLTKRGSLQCVSCSSKKKGVNRILNLEDFSGRRFGKWLVIRKDVLSNRPGRWWECVCVCGNTTSQSTGTLNNGTSLQCKSCQMKEVNSKKLKRIKDLK